MTVNKSPKTITVSFRDNDFDEELHENIMEESKVVGKSAWMKLAAWEKIQRDKKDIVNTNNTVRRNNSNNSNNTTIQSLDQMFKKQ